MADYERLFNALKSIIWYNGHDVWLKKLRDDMAKQKIDRYILTSDVLPWNTEKHTIWMLLVGMFGEWGTSINSGWIENIPECIKFIDAVCKDCWEAEENHG